MDKIKIGNVEVERTSELPKIMIDDNYFALILALEQLAGAIRNLTKKVNALQ